MKFTKGEIVRVLLTSEFGMVIDSFDDDPGEVCFAYERGYNVRLADYRVVRFYEFELTKREAKDGGLDKSEG